jgi:hypothetical protein
MSDTLDQSNFRKFAQKAIAAYDKKGMIVDEMLWAGIIGHYDAEIERLRAALQRVAMPGYGLQGLIEDGATDEEQHRYWVDRCGSMRAIARRALEGKP